MAKATASKIARVRDVMTSDVFTVAASTSLADAARTLTFHRVSGAPVIDRARIVGVISKTDLVDPRRIEGSETVAAAMTPMIYAVRPGDPAMSAIRLMAIENIHRVVVIGAEGKLVGIVTPMDVVRALARGDDLQHDDAMFEEAHARHGDPAVAVSYVDLRLVEIE